MAMTHSQPGEVIDVHPLGEKLASATTATLFKSEQLEVIRLVMAAGKVLPEHRAPSAITVQCLEGKLAFTALGRTRELVSGQMLYLNAGEPHSVECLQAASFLLTLVRRA